MKRKNKSQDKKNSKQRRTLGGPAIGPPPNRPLSLKDKAKIVPQPKPQLQPKPQPKPQPQSKAKPTPKMLRIMKELKALRQLIRLAVKDAPLAMKNEDIFDSFKSWTSLKFPKDADSEKSQKPNDLAYEFYVINGWTADWLRMTISESNAPFRMRPLSERSSYAFWSSVRWRARREQSVAGVPYKVDIPPEWLDSPLPNKRFGKHGGREFLCKVAAIIAWNQRDCLAKKGKFFHVRALCDNFGVQLPRNFDTNFIQGLAAVCCDPCIIDKVTKEVKGTFSTSVKELKEKFTTAIKAAKESNKVLFPDTLKLMEELFL